MPQRESLPSVHWVLGFEAETAADHCEDRYFRRTPSAQESVSLLNSCVRPYKLRVMLRPPSRVLVVSFVSSREAIA